MIVAVLFCWWWFFVLLCAGIYFDRTKDNGNKLDAVARVCFVVAAVLGLVGFIVTTYGGVEGFAFTIQYVTALMGG